MTEEILRSARNTDFGRNCFYVSDYLPTAINWAFIRNNQQAVIVFKMEDGWIENIPQQRKLNFVHDDQDSLFRWKNFVYESRKGRNNNYYYYVNGPILSNSRLLNNASEAEMLRTGRVIPYQSALKTNQLCEEFRTHILCIIFFRNDTTLIDNGM